MNAIYANPVTGTKTTTKLNDNMTDKMSLNHMEAELDAGGGTLIVRNKQGVALGEVFVELNSGNVLVHVWGKEDLLSGSPKYTGVLANRQDIRES